MLLTFVDGGRKLVYGTDTGIYVSDRRPKISDSRPRRVLDVSSVTQIDVLEEYQLLLVLANKNLVSYPLEVLDPNENQSPLLRRPKKIQNHSNFFKAGVCLGRHLVCSAKSSSLSTTIKVFEPTDTVSSRKRGGITQLFQGSQEALKPFKVSFPKLVACSFLTWCYRSSTFLPSPHQSTFSNPSFVLPVLVALKLSAWKPWRHNLSWTRQILLWTLWHGKRKRDRYT